MSFNTSADPALRPASVTASVTGAATGGFAATRPRFGRRGAARPSR